MAAPATKKISKFSVLKAATPQGAKRSANEIAVKGAAPEIPKASKVERYRTPQPSIRTSGAPLCVVDTGNSAVGPFLIGGNAIERVGR
jgi:hypothetical protein